MCHNWPAGRMDSFAEISMNRLLEPKVFQMTPISFSQTTRPEQRHKAFYTGLCLSLALFYGQATHATDSTPSILITPEGFRVEGFRVMPNVSLTESWNDNIYGTPANEESDTISTASASVKVNSDWARHRLNFDAGASADFYSSNDSEDAVDWWLGTDGRYDLSARSHALGGARVSQNHEDRSSPDSAAGALDPTTYITSRAHLGFAHQFAPFTIRVGGVVENLNFVDGSNGFDVDWRDRNQFSIGTRFSYLLNPQNEVFFQAATDTRDYDNEPVGRNSDGYRLGLGLRTNRGAEFEAEGFLGHMVQDYDNIALKDVNALYYGANLKWKPVSHTRLSAGIDRAVNETTYSEAGTDASSHLDTSINGRVEHDINSKFSLNLSLGYSNSDYQGVTLELDELSAGAGLRYDFDRRFYLAGGYRYSNRDANNPLYEYDRNLFYVSFGYNPRSR